MDDAAARSAPLLARWMGGVRWRPWWIAVAVAVGVLAGLLADTLSAGLTNGTNGTRHYLNLLAPPVWTVLIWNVAVYAVLLAQGIVSRRRATPVWTWRAAALMHAAAAGLGAGLIAGMYLRGLVFDYRAGWESTFLDAAAVAKLLSWVLAPAAAVTGVALPDATGLEALRVLPGDAAGSIALASARPWIHLLAATLALVVLLPRTLLTLHSVWRARQVVRAMQRQAPEARPEAIRVWVLPHAKTPDLRAAQALRTALAARYGESVQVTMAPAVPYGSETQAVCVPADDAVTVLLFDLSTTPEADTQGRLVDEVLKQRGKARIPLVIAIDESAFLRRFGAQPERVAQRRTGWTAFAKGFGATALFVDLDRPEPGRRL